MKNWILPILLGTILIGGSVYAYTYFTGADEGLVVEDDTVTTSGSDPSSSKVIGYVGCSNTWMTVEGYHTAGGEKFWPANKNFGGGNVGAWAESIESGSRQWTAFDDFVELYPNTDSVWWELCVIHEDSNMTHATAETILDAIHDRLPEATVYISSLPGYPDAECHLTKTVGIKRADELVIELLANNPELMAGPVLSPMTADRTTSDKCHINSNAREDLGREMILFFDES